MKKTGKLIVSICILVFANQAMAATITISASGVMSGYQSIPSIVAGDIWRAELTIDSETPNNRPGSASQGWYYGLTGNIYIGDTLISQIGGSGASGYPGPVVLVENDHQSWNEDEIAIFGNCCTSSPVDGLYVNRFYIFLRDSNFYGREASHSNPFDSHELSEILSVNSLAPFQDSTSDLLIFGMDLINSDGETTAISGSVTSFNAETSSVPIPATIWLFGSGLLGLIGVTIRKTA